MDDVMLEDRLENLDHRLEKVEQILPTVATKDELRATEQRLRQEIRSGDEDTRRHMTMLIEHQDDKIQLLAEHLLAIRTKLNV